MVSESFRSVPYTGSYGGSTFRSSSSTVLNGHNLTNGTNGMEASQSPVMANNQQVYGLLLVDDRTASCLRASFRRTKDESGSGSTNSPTNQSGRRPTGIILGSVVIDHTEMSGDELRRAVVSQVPSAPKFFAFLSKDGWPLLRAQETRITAANVINESFSHILIKNDFEKPRLGIVTASGDIVGFVFCDYLSPIKDFREAIDELLKESRPHLSGFTDTQAHYRFFDKNGWPVVGSQEEKLLVLDLLSNQNAVIQFKYERKDERVSYRDRDSYANSTNRRSSNLDIKYIDAEAKFALTERPSNGLDDRFKSTNNDSSNVEMVDNSNDSTTARGSKKTTSIVSWKPSIRRKQQPPTVSESKARIPKSVKSRAKPIMLSYARQEAAQHALDLKEELHKLGFQVYLDVHEIQTGTDWQDSLNEAVSQCVVFVPLVTPMYGKTQWTNREVKLADLLNKHILPINFLDHWPPECLAIQFATTQYVPWRLEDSDHNDGDHKSVPDIKFWTEVYVKRCAKSIGQRVPSIIEPKEKVTRKFVGSIKKIKPEVVKEVAPSETPDTGNSQLIVISAHPQQRALVNQVKSCLVEDGFQVWCSTDLPYSLDDEVGSNPVTPNQLPTISEDREIQLSETYKAIARRIVESKQRPLSLPIDATSPILTCDTMDGMVSPPAKKSLARMMSQISDISHLSSLTPEKMDKLKIFQDKVSSCGVVIVIVSEAYFRSRTSQQHVYYCEHRKKVVIVKSDLSRPPTWFTMLMGNEQQVSAKNSRFMEVIRGCVKRILDPYSTVPVDDLHESKMQYLVRNMRKNLPYLGTCVYIAGSTSVENPRTRDICQAIGTALAEVKNITLVTSGSYGVTDLVAQAFKKALEVGKNESEARDELQSRIVHVIPVKDEQDFSDQANQGVDGIFEPKAYGKTLFLGESVSEREAAIARLLDTCILIEGGPATAREVEEFIWNDHFVVPVITTGGAASGDFKVPLKIFECPHGVNEKDWRVLSNKEATAVEVSKAIVHIVVTIKQNIALHAAQRLELKGTVGAATKFKAKLRRSSKKRVTEKLDMSAALVPILSDEEPPSPDKILPLNLIDSVSNLPTDGKLKPVVKVGRWKKVGRFISFTKK